MMVVLLAVRRWRGKVRHCALLDVVVTGYRRFYHILGVGLVLLHCGFAQIVFVIPTTTARNFSAPGSLLPFSFFDTEGRNIDLPESGRYLLWILDSIYTTYDRPRIPWSDLGGVGDELVSNPVALLPQFGASYVVFYEGDAALPDAEARVDIIQRLSAQTVLFDDDRQLDVTLTDEAGYPARAGVEGFYLMEGRKVRYRFIGTALWENVGILELIQSAAETFLAGGEPALAPVAATRGGRLPDDVNLELPALVLRTTARVLKAERLRSPIVPPGGEMTVTIDAATSGRFLLETLPSLLAAYGAHGVALIPDAPDAATFEQLRAAFPGWTFIDMSVPEVRLLWLEVQTIVIDGAGQVLGSAILAPADGQGRYPNWLPDILQEASSR
jgi:hypothetical protein